MKYDLRGRDLTTILAEASLVADETERMFGHLSGEQLNWKPGPEEWSVGQCFDHVVISNRPYEPIVEEILAGRRRRRFRERVPLPHHRRARAEPLRPSAAGHRVAGLPSLTSRVGYRLPLTLSCCG